MVLLDAASPELRAQMSPQDWETLQVVNTPPADAFARYPDLERLDFDPSLDQVEAAPPIKAMPLAVLSADVPVAEALPDFGALIDRAQTVAQRQLAALVPGAVHVTKTRSGHYIMIDNAPIVTKWIRKVVAAVRQDDKTFEG
jgi:hypothetical protein